MEQKKEEIKNLVNDILDSYDKYPITRNIDCRNRINSESVSEILGHASTSVTIDTYAHLTEEKKRKQEEVIKTIKVL